MFNIINHVKVTKIKFWDLQEPTTRIELVTSSLPRKRSTPELRRPKIKERETGFEPATFSLEGWRSTNWATPAYSLFYRLLVTRRATPKPQENSQKTSLSITLKSQEEQPRRFERTCKGSLSAIRSNRGESRIRTCEVERQQIYSLPSLAAWVSPRVILSRWRDSNPRPADYKSAALASWATSAFQYVKTTFA